MRQYHKLIGLILAAVLAMQAQVVVQPSYQGLQLGGGNAYQRLPLNNLISLYSMRFGSTGGSYLDDSGNANNCTISGGTLPSTGALGNYIIEDWGVSLFSGGATGSCPTSMFSGQSAVTLYFVIRGSQYTSGWQYVMSYGPAASTTCTATTPLAGFAFTHNTGFGHGAANKPVFVLQTSSGSQSFLEFPNLISQTAFEVDAVSWNGTNITAYQSGAQVGQVSSVSSPAGLTGSPSGLLIGQSPCAADPHTDGMIAMIVAYSGTDSAATVAAKSAVLAKVMVNRINSFPRRSPETVSNSTAIIPVNFASWAAGSVYTHHLVQTADGSVCALFGAWTNHTTFVNASIGILCEPTVAGMSGNTPSQIITPPGGGAWDGVWNIAPYPYFDMAQNKWCVDYIGGDATGSLEAPPSSAGVACSSTTGNSVAGITGTYVRSANNPLVSPVASPNWIARQVYSGIKNKINGIWYWILDGASSGLTPCAASWLEQSGMWTSSGAIDGPTYTPNGGNPLYVNSTCNTSYFDDRREFWWLVRNKDASPQVSPYGEYMHATFDLGIDKFGGNTSPHAWMVSKDFVNWFTLTPVSPWETFTSTATSEVTMVSYCNPNASNNIWTVLAGCYHEGLVSHDYLGGGLYGVR